LGDHVGVRVYGVDTREMKGGGGGENAKKFVKALLPEGTEILLFDLRRDKYFRILSRIGYSCSDIHTKNPICQDLSTKLIEESYAVPYFGDKKKGFTKEIK
jgi:endonuclease YncB( thermonuclease family)